LKPDFIKHIDYQNFVIKYLNEYYADGLLTFVNRDWPIIHKLWITDLSDVHNLLIDTSIFKTLLSIYHHL
jgi:hypothetical protein